MGYKQNCFHLSSQCKWLNSVLRCFLYYFAPFRRVVLAICAAHFGAISGHLLWQSSYNPPEFWPADFTSIISSSLFDVAGSQILLAAAIPHAGWSPAVFITLMVQLKILMLCISGRRWNCLFIALYLSAIVLHFQLCWCWYVGDPTLFGWAFRK